LRTPHLVSVIVVNWNGKSFLKECLSALSQQTYSSYELILVDNGSIDGSIDYVRENYSWVRIRNLPENRGFSGGNLEGLKECQGEFIALVNNDTRADEKWLENLVDPMHADSTIGMCASKMLVDGTDQINSAGDGLTTAGVGYNRGLWKDRTFYADQEPVFGSCGGAVLYRRTMLDEIGFLDDDFFLYDEDTDLNFRAQLAGWKCMYVPEACIYHAVNGTSGRLSDVHVYYHTRNLEFVWLKNMPTGLMLRFAHHKLIQVLGSFFYLCLRHGKWKAFFRGKRDALRLFPRMLKKRRAIQRKRKVSNKVIKSLLTPIFSKELIGQKIQQFIKG
jgi:GT2 family glycosyltransferase